MKSCPGKQKCSATGDLSNLLGYLSLPHLLYIRFLWGQYWKAGFQRPLVHELADFLNPVRQCCTTFTRFATFDVTTGLPDP